MSYLVAPLSRDLHVAVHQQETYEWWDFAQLRYQVVISPAVLDEISLGDSGASASRLALVQGLPVLGQIDQAASLAEILLSRGVVPAKAKADALHVSFAAVNGVDYLVSWNCRHIANARVELSLRRLCLELGYEAPVLCTPPELTGD